MDDNNTYTYISNDRLNYLTQRCADYDDFMDFITEETNTDHAELVKKYEKWLENKSSGKV